MVTKIEFALIPKASKTDSIFIIQKIVFGSKANENCVWCNTGWGGPNDCIFLNLLQIGIFTHSYLYFILNENSNIQSIIKQENKKKNHLENICLL